MWVLHSAAVSVVVARCCQEADPGSASLDCTLFCSDQLSLQPADSLSGFCRDSLLRKMTWVSVKAGW